jgi:hypothetical protein
MLSGYFGPKPILTELASEKLEQSQTTSTLKFAYTISQISKFTHTFSLLISLEIFPKVTSFKSSMTTLIEASNQDYVARLFSRIYSPIPIEIDSDQINSRLIKLFFDEAVHYSNISIQFTFGQYINELKNAKIYFLVGNPENTVYQMIFRLLFFISLVTFISLFFLRFQSTKLVNWHMEQKLTILLLFSVHYTTILFMESIYSLGNMFIC